MNNETINNTEGNVVWVTGWRPKRFERFFDDFGIPAGEPQAKERSVAPDLLQRVAREAVRYGMHLSP